MINTQLSSFTQTKFQILINFIVSNKNHDSRVYNERLSKREIYF